MIDTSEEKLNLCMTRKYSISAVFQCSINSSGSSSSLMMRRQKLRSTQIKVGGISRQQKRRVSFVVFTGRVPNSRQCIHDAWFVCKRSSMHNFSSSIAVVVCLLRRIPLAEEDSNSLRSSPILVVRWGNNYTYTHVHWWMDMMYRR